ncbi:hypothetical protein V5799_023622 [Amblyomma americanum]|uniref:GH18 domain-containing protein n=1 Tax=Amblyomma americanum TaxID=6943 RepID=A0AAQ4FIK0_AMBAM
MGNLRLTTGKNHLRNLVSYGGGAHVQSLLNRIRDDRKAEDLINEIKFWLSELGIDGINFHLEGPGPPVCRPAEIETILNFIKTCRRVNYYHWKREWVKYAATPYIYYEDQWVSYDDKDSVDVKATWFRKHWLGGMFVWSLDADDYSGECIGEIYPMVTAAWKPMRHYRPIPMRRPEDETPKVRLLFNKF